MSWMRLTGYADKYGVHPGETIRFYVNCDGPKKYKAQLVKMIHGDTNPRGPGLIEKKTRASFNGEYRGEKQIIHSGSYGYVADKPQMQVQSFTVQCWIWPTTPKTHPKYWKHGAQGIVTKWHKNKGFGLFINEDGCAELRINDKKVTTGAPLRDHAWHFLAASYDAKTGKATLYHEPQVVYALDPEVKPATAKISGPVKHDASPTVIAGYTGSHSKHPTARSSVPSGIVIGGHYNGKIDSPRICNRALTRTEIETMKLGAQRGMTERRNSGPSAALSETDRKSVV